MKCFVFGTKRNNVCRINGCNGTLVRILPPDGKNHKMYSCSICGTYYMKATLFKIYSSDFQCINSDEMKQCLDMIREENQKNETS